tara:strand:+ start:6333 stop:6854 length:522 start_codon:yes stop_codon:yes gene_type:complete
MGVSDLNVQIQLEGAAAFQRALSELGKKEADKIRRAAITKETKEMEQTARSLASRDQGALKAQIDRTVRNQRGELIGRVGVAIKGKGSGRYRGFNSRKNLAHIIEFGRRPFFMRIRGRNGTRYSVKVPGTRGDRFLTRTAERHLRGLDKRLADRMMKSIERRLRKLEKTRGVA